MEIQATPHRRFDVRGAIGLMLAIAAIVAIRLPVISIVLSIAAIVVALLSRRSLRQNSDMAGATVSALGFIVGVIAFLLVAIPLAIGLGIQLFA